MNQIYNNRYLDFKNYCNKNTHWLDKFSIPIIKQNQEKETVFIEFRSLPHIYFVIKNAIRVLDRGWSHTIICGENNYNFILEVKERIGRNIKIIKINKTNFSRLEYSLLLLKSSFWKQFSGNYILIYQEDSIIFRNIPKNYFKYDYVGAPFFNKKIGNGGFSLRNKEKMIQICERYYDSFDNRMEESRIFLEKKVDFLKSKNIDYKTNINFRFLYNVEKHLLEDVLLCEKCKNLPSFMEAQEFSVEKYFYENPIGGHQFWYAVKDINKWLNLNLKKKL
jgi:hypothetical protein